MDSKRFASNALVALAVLCALTSTLIAVRREVAGPTRPSAAHSAGTTISNWQQYQSAGHRTGDSLAPVTIVEFADFECPVCRGFEKTTLPQIRKKFGSAVSVVFRHYPLAYHRFAYPTARAAECASVQGRFDAFREIAYAWQDSLGLVPLDRFAAAAAVPDSTAFHRCATRSDSVLAIGLDIAAGRQLGAMGTPTLLIGDRRVDGAASFQELDSLITAERSKMRTSRSR